METYALTSVVDESHLLESTITVEHATYMQHDSLRDKNETR